MTGKIYAQDAPQWGTRVSVTRTRMQIMEVLDRFDITDYGIQGGAVFFRLKGQTYRLNPRALPVSTRGQRTKQELEAQAECQAWRIIHDYIVGVTKLAWFIGAESALLQFLVLPSGETLGEIDVPRLLDKALPPPADDGPIVAEIVE